MKAILLAGGEGTRLRPLTADLPKPMVPLFGRPVLEHLILLLRRHGITQIAMTLGYLPEKITDYFGDGSPWGVSIAYFTEEKPLGTAGGVKACQSFLQREDCIVLSGDCVCDFDLSACIKRHRIRKAEATILLHRVEEPTEYGLVLTDEGGRVTRFAEKPSWSRVFTDQVNTGVYLLNNSVLEDIPTDRVWDFSRDLFPRLLEQKRGLYGDTPQGYWRDMGSCESYRQVIEDALEGRLSLELSYPQVQPGLYAEGLLPEDAVILPPCWIGPGVTLEKNCLIGPYAVLEQGSKISSGSVVRRSVLLGSSVGRDSTVNGSILCTGARTGPGVTLEENTALGSGVAVLANIAVKAGAKFPPGTTVSSQASQPLRFGEDGILSGRLRSEISPDFLLRLGGLLAMEGGCGLGHSGGSGAKVLALAAESGIASAGGNVYLHDASVPAAAGWLAGVYHLPVSLYLRQTGDRVTLYLFGAEGLPLPQERLRRLEAMLSAGNHQGNAAGPGAIRQVTGADRRYLDAAACYCPWPISPIRLSVSQDNREGQLLAESLRQIGCRVESEEREGLPAWISQPGGFGLALRTEAGRLLQPEWAQMLCCLILLEEGEQTLALPSSAPVLAERLAAVYGGTILRLGRDEGAEEHWQRLLPLRDGCAAGCLIAGYLVRRGQSLTQLAARLPRFALRRRELPLTSRAGAMEALYRAFPHAELEGDGLRVTAGGGSAWLSPMAERSALSIIAEGPTEEFAAELCDFISEKAKETGHL